MTDETKRIVDGMREGNFTHLADFIVSLSAELRQVKRERDAAVERLHQLRDCRLCDHERCANCRNYDDITMRNRYLSDNWRWGGVREHEQQSRQTQGQESPAAL